MNELIKAVVTCDIRKDPIIECGYDQQLFDVVTSSLAIDYIACTDEEYTLFISHLGKLLKPGGYLFLTVC